MYAVCAEGVCGAGSSLAGFCYLLLMPAAVLPVRLSGTAVGSWMGGRACVRVHGSHSAPLSSLLFLLLLLLLLFLLLGVCLSWCVCLVVFLLGRRGVSARIGCAKVYSKSML